MKVGFFIDDYFPSINGVNMVVHNYAQRLKKNIEVVIVVPFIDHDYIDEFDYKVIRVKSIRLKKYGYSLSVPFLDFKLKKNLLRENFDLIHIHSPFIMGRLGISVARELGIPVLGTIHTRFEFEFDRALKLKILKDFLLRYLVKTYNMCDKCFTMNNAIKDIYINSGIKCDISLIPNATDMVRSRNYLKDINFINKEYDINDKTKVFLFVGRINIIKNILLVADALKVVLDNNIKFKMFFIGPDEDKSILAERVKENNLTDNVIILDKITDRNLLRKFYVRADLFLFPSVFDTSSLVQVEAASQGTPTVFIEDCPTSSNIINNVNGFISKNDAESYGNKIVEVIKNNKLYNDVSLNCYRDLYISWDKVVKILLNEYKEIVK